MTKRKANLDDGCNPELVRNAIWAGTLELPSILPLKEIFIPTGITPYSMLHRAPSKNEAIGFFEKDPKFAEVLINPSANIKEFKTFKALITLDCSLYTDSPLATHVINLYRNRAIGCYYQQQGINIIPLVRWGDEYSYTTKYFPERIAFLGLPKHNIVTISTYGCIRGFENKYHFKAGLESMLETLCPKVVLVHGSMPTKIFNDYLSSTRFIQYPDWITRMKAGDK